MKAKDTQRSKRRASSEGATLLSACLFGVVGGCVCLVVLLLFCSFLCTFSKDPHRLFAPLGLACSVLSYLCAGFIASKKHPPALTSGALSGLMLCAVLFIISLFLGENLSAQYSLPIELLLRAALIGASMLGGVIASNIASRKRRRRRR